MKKLFLLLVLFTIWSNKNFNLILTPMSPSTPSAGVQLTFYF
jgi:hypothetical protein